MRVLPFATRYTACHSFPLLSLLFGYELLCSQPLLAQLCIPQASGVPGLVDPMPRWRNAANTNPDGGFPATMRRLDDPRWRGAVSRVRQGKVEFRALYHPVSGGVDSLYLSWRAKADLDLSQGKDEVWFGLEVSNTQAVVIKVTLNVSGGTLNAAKYGATADPVAVSAESWDAGLKSWQTVTLPWLKETTRGWTRQNADNFRWAFQMVVPRTLASGLQLPNPFRMWYSILVAQGTTVTPHPWPEGLPVPAALPAVGGSSWGTVTLGTSSTCPGDVELDPLQIGTDNANDYEILFTKIAMGTNTFTNTLHVRPRNLTSGMNAQVFSTGDIDAQFFLANWGSQPEVTTLWQKISPTPDPSNARSIDPGQTAHGDMPGNPRNDISFPWSVPDIDRCRFGDPDPSCAGVTAIVHHCMLVQLGSPTSTLVFRNQSAYRNMNFQPLSTLRERAEISVKGLTPLTDGRADRDVYLYVETRNLPAKAPPTPGGTEVVVVPGKDTMMVIMADTTLHLEWGPVRVKRGDTLHVPTKDTLLLPAADNVERMTTVSAAAHAARLTSEDVDQLLPTYRVHAYHTTGDTVVIGGVKHPLLEPQTSFGYYVGHDGELLGWRHELEGATLVQLAPNWYRIAVPNNGVAVVTTTIEALEPRPYALSLHGGISFPHGSFANAYDAGVSVTADLERRINATFSVVVLLGYHQFESATAAPDLDVYQGSASLLARLPTSGALVPYLEAGAGVYAFSPGPTDLGAHAGAGADLEVSPVIVLGVSYRVHSVFTSGSNTTFSSIQAGARLRL